MQSVLDTISNLISPSHTDETTAKSPAGAADNLNELAESTQKLNLEDTRPAEQPKGTDLNAVARPKTDRYDSSDVLQSVPGGRNDPASPDYLAPVAQPSLEGKDSDLLNMPGALSPPASTLSPASSSRASRASDGIPLSAALPPHSNSGSSNPNPTSDPLDTRAFGASPTTENSKQDVPVTMNALQECIDVPSGPVSSSNSTEDKKPISFAPSHENSMEHRTKEPFEDRFAVQSEATSGPQSNIPAVLPAMSLGATAHDHIPERVAQNPDASFQSSGSSIPVTASPKSTPPRPLPVTSDSVLTVGSEAWSLENHDGGLTPQLNSTSASKNPFDSPSLNTTSSSSPSTGSDATRPPPISSDSVLTVESEWSAADTPTNPSAPLPPPPTPASPSSTTTQTVPAAPTAYPTYEREGGTGNGSEDLSVSSSRTIAAQYAEEHSPSAGQGSSASAASSSTQGGVVGGTDLHQASSGTSASIKSDGTASGKTKVSIADKVSGTLEKTIGKVTKNEAKIEHGDAKKRGEL